MKGIVHFTVGVAAASCFPAAVAAGADGNPLYFLLGGIFGLLPDTLDFKFTRFFYRVDMTVTPDPRRPDAGMIADAMALAIMRAHATGVPVDIKLNTIQLAADRWQRYTVTLDVPGRAVHVTYGPQVDTGGNPLPDAPAPSAPAATTRVDCPLTLDYAAATDVDIFDGPVFRMATDREGRVCPEFIPWHRRWTHSLVVALVLGLAGVVIWGPLAGMIIAAAFAAHVAVDQCGFLGSNLFAPFTKRRSRGLKLAHSGLPFPNFMAVWLSLLLIFWNLAEATTGGIDGLNPLRYLLLGAGLPLGCFHLLQRRFTAAAS